MGTALGDLVVNLVGNAAPLVATLQSAAGQLAGFAGRAASILSPFMGSITGQLAGAASVAGVVKTMADSMGRAKEIFRESSKLEMSTTTYQELSIAATKARTDISVLAGEFRKLQAGVGAALEGGKEQNESLRQLGLSAEKLAALRLEDQAKAVGKALAGIESPALRAHLAVKLMGKSAIEALPVLTQMANLDQFKDNVLSEKTLDKLQASGKFFTTKGTAVKNWFAERTADVGQGFIYLTTGRDLEVEASVAAHERKKALEAQNRERIAGLAILREEQRIQKDLVEAEKSRKELAELLAASEKAALQGGLGELEKEMDSFARQLQDARNFGRIDPMQEENLKRDFAQSAARRSREEFAPGRDIDRIRQENLALRGGMRTEDLDQETRRVKLLERLNDLRVAGVSRQERDQIREAAAGYEQMLKLRQALGNAAQTRQEDELLKSQVDAMRGVVRGGPKSDLDDMGRFERQRKYQEDLRRLWASPEGAWDVTAVVRAHAAHEDLLRQKADLDKGLGLRDRYATSEQRARDAIADLERLRGVGAIDEGTYRRGLRAENAHLQASAFAPSAERGSREAWSIITGAMKEAQSGGVQERAAKAAEQTAENTAKIAGALAGAGADEEDF